MATNRLKILILSLSILLLACVNVEAADLNWSLTGTASGVGYTAGTPAEIKDDDEETYCGDSCGGTSNCSWDYSCEVEFTQSVPTINKAEICHEWSGGGQGCGFAGTWSVSLYYSGAWHVVMNGGIAAKTTDSDETGWSNVTKIKLIAHGDFYSEFGYPGALLHATYELRAFGPPPYTDIGIRMRKSGETIKIGVQDLEVTHKLRIRKGDTSYGIPLLVVDDPDASPIRIFNGTDVKNWPEVP